MNIGQWVLGIIILIASYFICFWGFSPIIGAPITYLTRKEFFSSESRLKSLRKSMIPFITGSIILSGAIVLELWLFPKYKVFFFIGCGISFIMSILSIGELTKRAEENAMREKNPLYKYFKYLKR